jgi:MOSC domain-containing protein YiiM
MSDRGWVFQVNRSAGGVPKLPVVEAAVTADGLTGDRQNDLRHHGGPERAVCLYSLERILDLQREGHPIFPGAAGENLTLAGLGWDDLGPGSRLEVGAGVELEVTRFTTPCRTIAGAFAGGAIDRILQDRHPGWSRLYARVLRPGAVRVGDRVAVVARRG